jgi:hypothetical protein
MKRSALIELIDETIRRNGWTDASVARDATNLGHKLTRQAIGNWRGDGGMKLLSPERVRALAAGLHLPPYRVALAVLEDLGIEVPVEVRSVEDAIHHDHQLAPHTKEQLLALLALERMPR